jgi:3D-(3,5/4)-trihydroxycyclohexane-1,2-dione acylhydrolase (decyclizing)
VAEIDAALGSWKADAAWTAKGRQLFKEWNALIDTLQAPTNAAVPTYSHVVGMVNTWAGPNDTMVTAAGGLPGETAKGWRVKNPNTFDLEFGFSAMGYEIAGGWGHVMAKNGSDIYSTVLAGHKMIVVVCDNGGYAVINRLQNFKGVPSFNNQIADCKVIKPFSVDFVKHAESMGAAARHCDSLADFEAALKWAKTTDRTTVISINTDAHQWAPGDADWEVRAARAHQDAIRKKQRVGV